MEQSTKIQQVLSEFVKQWLKRLELWSV